MRSQLLTLRVAQHSSRRSQSLAELLSIELSHRPLVKILSCLSPAHRFVPYCRQDTSEFDFLLHRTRKEEWPDVQPAETRLGVAPYDCYDCYYWGAADEEMSRGAEE